MRFLTLAALVAALASHGLAAHAQTTPAPLAAQRMGPWGFDTSGRDLAVKPGDDFYQWANGKWLERTQIPGDRTRFGNFDVLIELSEQREKALLEAIAAGAHASDRDAARIAAAWRSFMDEDSTNKLDAAPLAGPLAELRAAKTHADIARLMGRHNQTQFGSLFTLQVYDDAKDPLRYAVYVSTAGLGLPDRDYYLQPSFADKKAAYQAYVRQLLEMLQWPGAEQAAADIVALETRFAEASWTRVERRDRDKTYHPMSVAELQAYAPGLDWTALLAPTGLGQPERLILTSDTAFPKLAAVYAGAPVATLQAWAAFHLANNSAPLLSKRFVDAHFAFNAATLSGQKQQRERWKRGVTFVDGAVGMGVGRLYAAQYFPPESKATMLALVGNIRDALRQRIEKLDWMGPATKTQALDKLAKIGVKIGYPDSWQDYGALQLKADDLYGNAQRVKAYDWNRVVARRQQPVDRAEWARPPQTVNAWYSPSKNDITFPAAILQPPFFDPQADPAINFGAIGGVIGHEISHGFDDQGRKSDGDGRLRDWWTADDAAKFGTQATRLGQQYDAFEPLPGARVNGQLTMGENIGDLGGVSLALDAYRLSLGGKPSPVIEGTSGDQRVFLGWAQIWRSKASEDRQRQLLKIDTHSPSKYRVNGILRNMDAWYQVFDIKPGDKLYVLPEQRVRIW